MNALRTIALTTLLSLSLVSATAHSAHCCPFCSAPSLTLTEQLTQADAAVLVQWVDGKPPEEKAAGSTTYMVVEVARGPKDKIKKDEKITVPRFRAGKKGDLFLLTGVKDKEIDWQAPLEVSEASYQYIVQAPSSETPTAKRLEYFLKFMEFPDQLVSNDAYGEFANAPYEDILKIRGKMDRTKIAKWLTSKETSATRIGLYGLLLGLCGQPEDAEVMRKKIEEKTEDFRLGIDGVTSGYLLLTGGDGLDIIDKTKLRDKKAPFSETYAAMQALRFMWSYGNDRITKERLRQSMRELLDRPELADLVVADLARWEDWSIQDRLMSLYGEGDYNIPSIKRAIVRYLLTAAKVNPPKANPPKFDDPKKTDNSVAANSPKPEELPATTKSDLPKGDDPKNSDSAKPIELPAHVLQARANLEALREKDPKTVKDAERFFFLQ